MARRINVDIVNTKLWALVASQAETLQIASRRAVVISEASALNIGVENYFRRNECHSLFFHDVLLSG
jgi:hypothetical protein